MSNMPGFDQTGPQGMGPLTGRGFGPCGFGRMGFGRGRGLGKGRGLGRYFGWDNGPVSKQDQKKELEEYKKALQEEMEDVNKELADMDSEA